MQPDTSTPSKFSTILCLTNLFAGKEDSLEIFTPENSYIMYAGTKNEKKVWLQKLRTTIAMALHGPEATEKDEIGNYYQLFVVFILSTCSVTSDIARYFAQIVLDPLD